jgi:alanyl-tRNA synthetase
MEEMNEMFYREPYRQSCYSTVVSCVKEKDGYAVALEDTVFYPEGGGQPGDTGTLNGVKVVDTIRRDGTILHLCTGPIEPGTEVKAVIDWDRRFRHMQAHTGEHIVSGLVHQLFGYDNVGFHMGEVIQIDFDGVLSEKDCAMVEEKANEAVWQNLPVRTWFPADDELEQISYRSKKELSGKIRLVTMDGVDQCACCGTHVSHTGEVGLIQILSLMKHKDGVRLTLLCGRDAYEHDRAVRHENDMVSHCLSVPVTATGAAVEKLQKEKEQETAEKNQWRLKYIEDKIEASAGPLFLLAGSGLDRMAMRRAASLALDRGKHTAVLLNEEENGTLSYLVMSDERPLKTLAKNWNARLNGRGGGRDDMVQGSFQATEADVINVLKEDLS